MIRTITRSLALTSCLFALQGQAALPENVSLQRDGMQALTLLLQFHGEGAVIRAEEQQALEDNLKRLQLHAASAADSISYAEKMQQSLVSLEAGQSQSSEDMATRYAELMQLLEKLHQQDRDAPYLSLLRLDYLSMRYAFASYIGIPSSAQTGSQYYRSDVSDVLQQLNLQLNELLPQQGNAGLGARWRMLHPALSDMHEGWTRTRSGNPFSPLVVSTNARLLGEQLTAILER